MEDLTIEERLERARQQRVDEGGGPSPETMLEQARQERQQAEQAGQVSLDVDPREQSWVEMFNEFARFGAGVQGPEERERNQQRIQELKAKNFEQGLSPPEERELAERASKDDMMPFVKMLSTEAERGFRMFQQQTAAKDAVEAQERDETAGQTSVSRTSGLGPGTFAEESAELSEEEQRRATKRSAEQIKRAEEEMKQIETTEAMTQLQDAIKKGEGGAFWNTLWSHPEASIGLAVQSSAMQPDALIASGLASMAGPAATTAVGGAGAYAVESRAAITEEMRNRGVDFTDTQQVMETLQDPEFRAAARERGKARGATIASVDMATNLLTAGLGRTALRPWAKAAIGFGGQTAGEATGEGLAQLAAGEETNPAEISAEAVGAAPLSTIETFGTLNQDPPNQSSRKAREGIAEAAQRANQAGDGQQAQQDRPLARLDDQQLENQRERAQEQNRQQDVQIIDEELERREQEEQADGDTRSGSDRPQSQRGAGDTDTRQQGAGRADTERQADEQAAEGGQERDADVRTPDDPLPAAREALERARQQRMDEGATADPSGEGATSEQSGRSTFGIENLPEDPAPDVGQQTEEQAQPEGEQGELAEGMGQRTQTRPEEQVDEEVSRLESEVEDAKVQLSEAKNELLTQLDEVPAEEKQRVAEETDDPEVERLARMALENDAEQGSLPGMQTQGQQANTGVQTPDMFGGEGRNVSKALQNAARKLRQRRAGLEAKRQELQQARQAAPDAKSQQRDAQQEIDTDPESTDQPDEPEPDTDQARRDRAEPGGRVQDDDEASEGAGTQDDGRPAGEDEAGVEETDRDRVPPPPPGDARTDVRAPVPAPDEGETTPGEVVVTTTAPDETTEEATAELTDDELRVTSVSNPRQLIELAEEAASRGIPLRTDSQVDIEMGNMIEDTLRGQGYTVMRHPDIDRINGGYEAPGAAFTIRAPQIDPDQAQTTTEEGHQVGYALRSVTRRTTRSERPQGQMTDMSMEELQSELDEAVERGDEQFAEDVRSTIDRVQQQGRQTTYQHKKGDIVVRNEEGQLIDARSAGYREAVARFFTEHEEALREGTVRPSQSDGIGVRAAMRSSSPQQILDTYLLALQQEREAGVGQARTDLERVLQEVGRVQTASFRAVAGDGAIAGNGALTMNWLSPNGTPLDDIANRIEQRGNRDDVSMDEIVEYMQENPTRTEERASDRLADRFAELTGLNITEDFANQIRDAQTPDQPPSPDDVPDVDAPFQTISEDGPATAKELVEAIIERVIGEEGIPSGNVTVAQTIQDLPDPIQEVFEAGQRQAGEGQTRPAVYLDGDVYIVAEGIEKAALALGTDFVTMARISLHHEVVAHQGLRGLLGEDFDPMMDDLADAIGTERLLNAETHNGVTLLEANADRVEFEDGELTQESKRLLADEFLANMAEDMAVGEETQRTVFTTIKEWFARVFNFRLLDSEIELLLQASRDHLRGQQEGNPVEGSRFDRRMDDQHPERWMVLGESAADFDAAQSDEPSLFDPSVYGVFRGPYDDALRFEIDDSDAGFNPNGPLKRWADRLEEAERAKRRRKQLPAGRSDDRAEAHRTHTNALSDAQELEQTLEGGVPIDQIFSHDTLFEQYPQLAEEVTVELTDTGPRNQTAMAGYSHDRRVLMITDNLLYKVRQAVNNEGKDVRAFERSDDPRTVREAISFMSRALIHELQHWVQYEEGFAIGASPLAMADMARKQLEGAAQSFKSYESFDNAVTATETLLKEYNQADLAERSQEELAQELRNLRPMSTADANAGVRTARTYEWDIEELKTQRRAERQHIEARGLNPNDSADRQTLTEALRAQENQSSLPDNYVRRRAQELYEHAAGEIEARIAQERTDLTPEERRQDEFYEDAAVAYPPEEVVTRFSTYSQAPNQLSLFQDPDSKVEHNLVAMHNLSERNVEFAVEQMDGHIPVPSVAVARYDIGFSKFGPISLVGPPDLADPGEGVPVYDSDVYSPRTPKAQYKHKDGAVTTFTDEARPYAERTNEESSELSNLAYILRNKEDRGKAISSLKRSRFGKLMYLDQVHDRQIEIPTKENVGNPIIKYDPLNSLLKEIEASDIDALNNLYDRIVEDETLHDRFVEGVVEAAKRWSKAKLGQVNDSVVDAQISGIVSREQMSPSFAGVDRLWRTWRDFRENPETIDRQAFADRVNEAIEEEAGVDSWRDAMAEWATRRIDELFGEAYLEDPRSGREMPMEVQTAVDIMTSENVQASEDAFLTSLSNARARGARQFETLEDIQEQRDRIISQDQMDQLQDELSNDFNNLREQLNQHLAVGGTFSRMEQPVKALADMLQRRISLDQAAESLDVHGYDVNEMPRDVIQAFMSFGETLVNSPTEYFEAKPQRAVALSEFEAAIVPANASNEIQEMLSEEVGQVETYEPNNTAERQEMVEKVSGERDVRFQSISEEQMGHRFMTANDGEQASMQVNQNMVAVHNLSPSGLQWALDKMDGHIPAPSVAITKIEEEVGGEAQPSGFYNFGKVSLLAPPSTINPEREPVFAADAYTPTTPQVSDEITRESSEKLRTRMNNILEGRVLGPIITDPGGIGGGTTEQDVADVGVDPDTFERRIDQILDQRKRAFQKHIDERVESSVLGTDVWANILYAEDQGWDTTQLIRRAGQLAARASDSGIEVSEFRTAMDDLVTDRFEQENGFDAVGDDADLDELRASIDKDFEVAQHIQDEYVERETVFFHPRTNEKTEATPQAVADAIVSKGIRAQQYSTGTGATRAAGTRQFESIEDIQEHRDRLVERESMHHIKTGLDNEVRQLGTELARLQLEDQHEGRGRRLAEQVLREVYNQGGDIQGKGWRDLIPILDAYTANDLFQDVDTAESNLVQQAQEFQQEAQETFDEWVQDRGLFYTFRGVSGESIETDLQTFVVNSLLREMAVPMANRNETDQAFTQAKNQLFEHLNSTLELSSTPEEDMSAQQRQAQNIIDEVSGMDPLDLTIDPNDQQSEERLNEWRRELQDYWNQVQIESRVRRQATQGNVAKEVAQVVRATAEDLKTAETEYFEAKPTRAVPLSEFRAALVPETMSDIMIGRLEEQGLEVRTYSTKEERAELQGEFEDIRFQTTGYFASDPDADVPIERPNRIRTLSDAWDWVRSHMRRLFTSRGDLPQSVFDADVQRQGWLKATIQRVKWTMTDFQAALDEEYGDNLTETETRRINEALGNGWRRHDVDQAELFKDDPQIEEAVPAHDLFFSEIPLRPEAVRQEKTYIEDLPEGIREEVGTMREQVDEMSRAGIKTGLFSGQLKVVVEQNMGTYLTRAYRIHDEPDYGARLREFAKEQADDMGIEMDPDQVPDDVPATAWNRAVGWYRQNHPHMTDDQIMGRLLELLRQGGTGPFVESGELGQIPGEIYKSRKDIPEELRALLGQYNDPATNFQKSMVKQARAVANQAFLNEVKQKGLGSFLFREPQVRNGVEYTEPIGEDVGEAMAPLSNLYTTPEIAQAFRQYNTSPDIPGWQRQFIKMAVGMKLGKTVGSVRTQFRNYYGNILFALSMGHLWDVRTGTGAAVGAAAGFAAGGPVGSVVGAGVGTIAGLSATSPKQEAWKFAIKSFRGNFESEEHRQAWQRMLELGVVGDAVRAGEFRELVEDLDLSLDDPDGGMTDFQDEIMKATGQRLEKLYQLGDEIWKVYAYQIEKNRYANAKPDWSTQRVEEKAAKRVRNGYPTYSLVPKIMKELRRVPTNAPFVSFYSEVFRTTFHSIRMAKEDLSDPDTRHIGVQRAAGIIAAQAVPTLLYEISKYLSGYDDEDDEWLRRHLPSWSQFSTLFHLPAEDGKAAYVDIGYINPYKGYAEPVLALMQGKDVSAEQAAFNALGRALDPFISEELLSQRVREAIMNRSSESGNPVVNPALREIDLTEFHAKRVAHVLKGFEPGTSESIRRIYQAATEKQLGQDLNLTQELLSPITGQRMKTVDMQESLKWEVIGSSERYRSASRLFTTKLYQDRVERQEIEKGYRDMVRAKEELIEHLHLDAKAAMNFGVTPRQAYTTLRQEDLGKEQALMVMAGQYVPTPNENILKPAIEGAMAEGRKQDAQELLRRRKIAIDVMQQVINEYRENHPSIKDQFEGTRTLLQSSQQ